MTIYDNSNSYMMVLVYYPRCLCGAFLLKKKSILLSILTAIVSINTINHLLTSTASNISLTNGAIICILISILYWLKKMIDSFSCRIKRYWFMITLQSDDTHRLIFFILLLFYQLYISHFVLVKFYHADCNSGRIFLTFKV